MAAFLGKLGLEVRPTATWTKSGLSAELLVGEDELFVVGVVGPVGLSAGCRARRGRSVLVRQDDGTVAFAVTGTEDEVRMRVEVRKRPHLERALADANRIENPKIRDASAGVRPRLLQYDQRGRLHAGWQAFPGKRFSERGGRMARLRFPKQAEHGSPFSRTFREPRSS